MHLISFYTNEPFYVLSAKALALKCRKLDIPHSIIHLDIQNEWSKTTLKKPQFILKMLKKLKKPVLWVDVDSIIVRKPIVSTDKSIGLVRSVNHPSLTIKAGTIYFKYNEVAIDFLEQWVKLCAKGAADHGKLQYVYSHFDKKAIKILAVKYCSPVINKDTVIQYIISRTRSKQEWKRNQKK